MSRLSILDCTLRDGGYCNDCNFGYNNKKKIIKALCDANIDIIECGFLKEAILYDPDRTRYSALSQMEDIRPENMGDRILTALMNYGDYDVSSLPECDGSSLNGIRLAFHKNDMNEALELCRIVKSKGYLLFVQPMLSLNYTDREFLELIEKINDIKPYAFYIVDSFGNMKQNDLIRLFYLVEHNLSADIRIGYHSHNNMQLAYSNAQCLALTKSSHDMIIDCSVYGMGRGAGNLNTELFVNYINENICHTYDIRPLISVIDGILSGFYKKAPWGYSLPNYLSASHNAHPNYASYLDEKNTLNVEDMNEIFSMMDENKKIRFDKAYIEELYLKYMEMSAGISGSEPEIRKILENRIVLLIAPGKSSTEEKEKIIDFINKGSALTVSINYKYPYAETDFIFASNMRRFKDIGNYKSKCIITSNINSEEAYYRADYKALLAPDEAVRDNAGLMAIKFMIDSGVSEIILAGFDGYSHSTEENYGESYMEIVSANDTLDALNRGMSKVLDIYAKKIKISFLTSKCHI